MELNKGDLVVIENPVDDFILPRQAMGYHGQLGIVVKYWCSLLNGINKVVIRTTRIDPCVEFRYLTLSTKYLELIEPNFE